MRRTAFTIAELLVVILVALSLVGLSLALLLRFNRSQARLRTISGLKQMTLACHTADESRNCLPPATGEYGGNPKLDATLHVHLLPFVGHQDVYVAIRQGSDSDHMFVSPFVTPEDPTMISGSGVTTFAANLRVFSDLGLGTKHDRSISPVNGNNPATGNLWFYGAATRRHSFPDGTSNTIAFVTQYSVCGIAEGRNLFANSAGKMTNSPFFGYYAPTLPASTDEGISDGRRGEVFQLLPALHNCNPSYTAQSTRNDAIWVSLFDGSVRLVSSKITPKVWGLAVQPNDGKRLDPDEWPP
jgi:Protein of unknown function (DUF1559)